MRLFKPSANHNQEETTSQFERDVLAIAKDENADLQTLDDNGHSAFYNLFNETVMHYGDNRQEVTR